MVLANYRSATGSRSTRIDVRHSNATVQKHIQEASEHKKSHSHAHSLQKSKVHAEDSFDVEQNFYPIQQSEDHHYYEEPHSHHNHHFNSTSQYYPHADEHSLRGFSSLIESYPESYYVGESKPKRDFPFNSPFVDDIDNCSNDWHLWFDKNLKQNRNHD